MQKKNDNATVSRWQPLARSLIPIAAGLIVLAMGASYVLHKDRLRQLERRMAAEETGRTMVRHVEQQLQQALSTASLMAAAMHEEQSDETTDLLAERVLKLHPAVVQLKIERPQGNLRAYTNGRLGAVLTTGHLPGFRPRESRPTDNSLLYPFGPPQLSISDKEILATQTIHQQSGKTSNRFWGTVAASLPAESLVSPAYVRRLSTQGIAFSIAVARATLPTESMTTIISSGLDAGQHTPVHNVDLANGDRVVLRMQTREPGVHHAYFIVEFGLVIVAASLFGLFLFIMIDFRAAQPRPRR